VIQEATSNLRELAKSLASFSGAATLFGLGQLGQMLDVRPTRPSSDELARRLDAVTRSLVDHLDGRLAGAFARTDDFQRAVVDIMADILTFNPSGLLASSGPILDPLASALDPLMAIIERTLPGTDARVRWSELRNKIEIYVLVADAESRIGISPVERFPLPDLVGRAYALGPFLAVWSVEGLGRIYGDRALAETSTPRGLLTGPEADASYPGALLMLHAGIGQAFALSTLGRVTPANAADTLPTALRDFISLCRENSRPGYVGAAYESLGLVTRTFHQDLIAEVDRVLQQSAGDLVGYFWHGVGRAIYFAPRNFLPCTDIDWAGAPLIAPHEIGRLNVTAGLAWAVTQVNMRQPAVMVRLLGHHGDVIARTTAFANGVSSSIIMRHDTTPDAPFLDDFLHFEPRSIDPIAASTWHDLVKRPADVALKETYGTMKRADTLGQLFHYLA
jgi:hypothetical protein